jgi:hypothetical protein
MLGRGHRIPSLGVRAMSWLTLVWLACGCGPRFANMSGTVTYQGKPVAGGTITFFDAGNRAASGAILPDGSYAVAKVTVGRARIAVVAPMDIPFQGLDERGGKGAPTATAPLPAKYNDPEQSGLTCDVLGGDQKYDISLE